RAAGRTTLTAGLRRLRARRRAVAATPAASSHSRTGGEPNTRGSTTQATTPGPSMRARVRADPARIHASSPTPASTATARSTPNEIGRASCRERETNKEDDGKEEGER